jgi:hypothetical protein
MFSVRTINKLKVLGRTDEWRRPGLDEDLQVNWFEKEQVVCRSYATAGWRFVSVSHKDGS